MNNFDTKNLNLNLLGALQALLSEKNVTLAGEKLGLSQSAMSHCLKQLRLHYKDPLLVKGKHNVLILTPLAESLVVPLHSLSEEIDKIFYPNNQFIPEQARTKFNIAMPDYISMVFLPALLKKIRSLAPRVGIIVHPLNHINNIEQFEDLKLDLAIGMYKNPPLDLKIQYLFSDEAVCVSCKLNKNIKNSLSLDDYLQLAQVLIGYKPDEKSIYINNILGKTSKQLDIAAILPYTLSVLHMISGSPFVTVTLKKIAKEYCKILNLKAHELPFTMRPYKANQYWHVKNHNAPEQIWLRKLVREIANDMTEKK